MAWVPSAEFVESFVIFLYGSTNVFLEHLAGWGVDRIRPRAPFDLYTVLRRRPGKPPIRNRSRNPSHQSLKLTRPIQLGLLVESSRIRNLLNRNIPHATPSHSPSPPSPSRTNPLPALVILLLGILMSSHHQASALSTSIHAQWGTLLAFFGLLRILTYIVIYNFPPTSTYPSRPPTELLTSFCLIVGGIVFCASTEDVVAWMEGQKVMGTFVLTLAAALGLVIMAWVVVVVGVKRWAGHPSVSRPTR